jgi:hypothetical protein
MNGLKLKSILLIGILVVSLLILFKFTLSQDAPRYERAKFKPLKSLVVAADQVEVSNQSIEPAKKPALTQILSSDEVDQWLARSGRTSKNLLIASLGCSSIFKGNPQKRNELILEALSKSPMDPDALTLGISYGLLDEPEKSLELIRSVDPDNAGVVMFQAKVAVDKGDFETAAKLLGDAARLPKYTSTFQNLRTDCKEMLMDCGRTKTDSQIFAAFSIEDPFIMQPMLALQKILKHSDNPEIGAYIIASMDNIIMSDRMTAKNYITAYGEQMKALDRFRENKELIQPYLNMPYDQYVSDLNQAMNQRANVFSFLATQYKFIDGLSAEDQTRLASRALEMGQVAAVRKTMDEMQSKAQK